MHTVARPGAAFSAAARSEERAAVMAHVAGCAECQRELAALERTASDIVLAASPLPMAPAQRDRIRARLMARAAADRAFADRAFRTNRSPTRRLRRTSYRSAPCARGMDMSTWMAMAAGRGRRSLGMGGYLQGARASATRCAGRCKWRQAERGAQIACDGFAPGDARGPGPHDREPHRGAGRGDDARVGRCPTSPTGRMFWDQAHDAWTLVAHRVSRCRSRGRTYQLWLVTPTAKISAGTFAPAPNGEVMMRATYADCATDALGRGGGDRRADGRAARSRPRRRFDGRAGTGSAGAPLRNDRGARIP